MKSNNPNYPEKKDSTKKLLGKKCKKTNNNNISQFISNPLINHMNSNSIFIYDKNDYIKYFLSLINKNCLKCNNDEISFLKNVIRNNRIILESKNTSNLILVDNDIFEKINNYFVKNEINSDLGIYLKEKLLESDNRGNLSCRKLANLYFIDKGIKISKSTVNNVLRKELNYHYLKTCCKSNFLKNESGVLFCFGFIKSFVRALKSGFEPIFIDESKIELVNNHFKCWRMVNETIHFGNTSKIKNNLLLAVGKDFVSHYSITTENTNSNNFLIFLKELSEKLLLNKDKNYVFIMDNLICHKNDEVIKYLVNSRLCTIFNAPYCSMFNAVELAFRAIKRKIYANLYNSIEDVKNEINNYLKNENISLTLVANYCETLEQYLLYLENNKSVNLNNFITIQ